MSQTSHARRWLAPMLVIAAIVAFAACSPPPTQPAAAPPTNSNATTDPNAVLRFLYANAPGTLDPQVVNTAFANVPLFLIFDRLVHVDTKGNPVPGLAESWKYSPDGKTLTMKLRSGVTFQDGTPFNAQAAKANIDRGKTVKGSFVADDLKAIASAEAPDDSTLKLNLSVADVALVLKLSDRAGAMISPQSMNSPNINVMPVGAGMYKVESPYQVGVKLKLTRWDGYWDKPAQKLAGVEMGFNTDTTSILNAIRSGGADAGYIREPEIDPAKKAGLTVLESYDLGFGNILINPDLVPALKDERVRLAVNLAIDRQAIVDGGLFGYGKVTNQPFPEGYFAHSDKAQNYPYDPKRAKDLLAQGGYPDGFDLEMHNVPGPTHRITEILAGQLGKVGIKVKVLDTEAAALTSLYSVDKTVDSEDIRWTGRQDPSSTLGLIFMPGGINNPSNMASDKAVELYNQQLGETDLSKRAELLQALSQELVEHPPASDIVLFQSLTATAATKSVIGLQSYVTGKLEFRGVGMTK